MNHYTSSRFWKAYEALPEHIQKLADENFELLKADPKHPSLHFKQIGQLWSARVGLGYRALALDGSNGIYWFWIGTHAEYDRLLKTRK